LLDDFESCFAQDIILAHLDGNHHFDFINVNNKNRPEFKCSSFTFINLKNVKEFFSSHVNKKNLKFIDFSSVACSDAIFYQEYFKDNQIDYIEAPLLVSRNSVVKLYAATTDPKFFQSAKYLLKSITANVIQKGMAMN
jgi:hypothetical protein